MPCQDSNIRPTEEERLTSLLCSACRVLKRLGYDFDENPSLSHWWKWHQEIDRLKDE